MHPLFRAKLDAGALTREDLIKTLGTWKPKETVLEHNKHANDPTVEVMNDKRRKDQRFVRDAKAYREEIMREAEWAFKGGMESKGKSSLEETTEEDVADVFSEIVGSASGKVRMRRTWAGLGRRDGASRRQRRAGPLSVCRHLPKSSSRRNN